MSALRTSFAASLVACATTVAAADTAHMVVLQNQDISGKVFKRLGLPEQHYCWEECLAEARCVATRWGVIEGATAGQCQLFEGEVALGTPRALATSDGQKIVVTASRKETRR
jgi:hypothetical protein